MDQITEHPFQVDSAAAPFARIPVREPLDVDVDIDVVLTVDVDLVFTLADIVEHHAPASVASGVECWCGEWSSCEPRAWGLHARHVALQAAAAFLAAR